VESEKVSHRANGCYAAFVIFVVMVRFISVLGNKGAVCIRFELGDTSVCIVNAHLSAHREAMLKRNDDYNGIITAKIFHAPYEVLDEVDSSGRPVSDPAATNLKKETMAMRHRLLASMAAYNNTNSDTSTTPGTNTASSVSPAPPAPAAPAATHIAVASSVSAVPVDVNTTTTNGPQTNISITPTATPALSVEEKVTQQQLFVTPSATVYLSMTEEKVMTNMFCPDDHDIVLWLGDLNYRITEEILLDDVYTMIENMDLPDLAEYDQLLQQRALGVVFEGFHEGKLVFQPTYQYIPGTATYDRREGGKNRCPAWCDRIMWRTGRGLKRIADCIRADRALALEQYLTTTHDDNDSGVVGFGTGVIQAVRSVYDVVSTPFPAQSLVLLNKIVSNVFVSSVRMDGDEDNGADDDDGSDSDSNASNVDSDMDQPSTSLSTPASLLSTLSHSKDSDMELVGSPRANPMLVTSPTLITAALMQQDDDSTVGGGGVSNVPAVAVPSGPVMNKETDRMSRKKRSKIKEHARVSMNRYRGKIHNYDPDGLRSDDEDNNNKDTDASNLLTREMALASANDPMNTAQDMAKIFAYIQSEVVKEKVELLYYGSCADVLISDHIPVRALLQLQYKK
jgi:hypothetical protein